METLRYGGLNKDLAGRIRKTISEKYQRLNEEIPGAVKMVMEMGTSLSQLGITINTGDTKRDTRLRTITQLIVYRMRNKPANRVLSFEEDYRKPTLDEALMELCDEEYN